MKNIINEKPQYELNGRLRHTVESVKKTDIENKTILDIGCGYGWFEMYSLKNNVKHIYACEVSEGDLETIKANVKDDRLTISVASAIKLPFDTNTFDTAVSWEVIEHIPKNTEQGMWNEVSRVLKPGGVLYLSTPFDSLPSKVFDPAWWLIGHRHYSIKRLEEFANKSGMKITDYWICGRWWLVLDILNMYVSKWIFRRSRFFKEIIDPKVDEEYSNKNGFMNIFIRAEKV